MRESPGYQRGDRKRYRIERKFGKAKENHGLRRCRCVGRLYSFMRPLLPA